MFNKEFKNNNKSLIAKIVSFRANVISNIFSDNNKINYKSPSLICGGKNINELILSENNLEQIKIKINY